MRSDEVTGISRLARAGLSGGTARIHEVHQGIADRAFRAVGPAGRPGPGGARRDRRPQLRERPRRARPGCPGGRRCRRAAGQRPRPRHRPGRPGGPGDPQRGPRRPRRARGPRPRTGHEHPGVRPRRPAGHRGPAADVPRRHRPARRLPARPHRDRGLLGVRGREAPRRRDGHLRQPAAARPRPDAGLPALQHGAAHLGERPLARRAAGRAGGRVAVAGPGRRPHRALDGRPGRSQRPAPGRQRDDGRAGLDPSRPRHRHPWVPTPRCARWSAASTGSPRS